MAKPKKMKTPGSYNLAKKKEGGSSIRANHVGLKASEAQATDAALAAMVYLQQFYFLKLITQNFHHFTYFCSLISTHSSILIIKTKSQIMFPNFNTSIFYAEEFLSGVVEDRRNFFQK
jgi:hypothetical protein